MSLVTTFFLALDALVAPDVRLALENNPEPLKLSFEESGADLLSKIMQGGDERYRLSTAFQMRPVMIVPGSEPRAALPKSSSSSSGVGTPATEDEGGRIIPGHTSPPFGVTRFRSVASSGEDAWSITVTVPQSRWLTTRSAEPFTTKSPAADSATAG